MIRTLALSALAISALGLTACGKPAVSAQPAAAPAPETPPARRATAVVQGVQLRDDGLHMVVYAGDSDLKFGTPMKDAIAAIDGMLGPGSKPETNSECGAGPIAFVKWPDGFSGLFQDGRFVGWSVDDGSAKGAYVTDKAVGVGSTRAELLAAYPDVKIEESTLGTEFTVGDYDGLLQGKGGEAKVGALWAGTSCVFR
jgi:hypothetical protein